MAVRGVPSRNLATDLLGGDVRVEQKNRGHRRQQESVHNRPPDLAAMAADGSSALGLFGVRHAMRRDHAELSGFSNRIAVAAGTGERGDSVGQNESGKGGHD